MRVLLVAGGLAALATAPVQAATHHKSHSSSSSHHNSSKSTKHGSASHHAKSSHGAKSTHGKTGHDSKKPDAKKPSAPGGTITVGSGGTKLFCAGRASPLLVRKATQGNGTTVMVICR